MQKHKSNFLSCALSAAAVAVMISTPVLADSPEAFLKDAIQGNIAEVKMGELAQKNGGSDQVKAFGKMLETDHGKARDKTMSLAKTMKVTPPMEPSSEAKAAYDKMAKMTGTAFDKEFAHHMVMDHQKDITKYEDEAKEKNGEVSKYAEETLPALKKHLQTAQALDK